MSDDLDTLLREQAATALRKAQTEHCTNFDKGAVFHWAERGYYQVVPAAQPAPVTGQAQSQAAADVLAERARQISAEGWDDVNDDCHDRSELAQAAACYALSGTPADEAVFIHGRWNDPRDLFWPHSWSRDWWKPTDRRRDLVKAGALILAEIERLDRALAGEKP